MTKTEDVIRQAVIDTDGLDEEIRCEMCKNPMHTGRGCDGNCKYDERLYERIMQILDKRIKPLPSTQPEIVRCKDCRYWEESLTIGGKGYCKDLYGFGRWWKAEDFCSYAKRRNNEPEML